MCRGSVALRVAVSPRSSAVRLFSISYLHPSRSSAARWFRSLWPPVLRFGTAPHTGDDAPGDALSRIRSNASRLRERLRHAGSSPVALQRCYATDSASMRVSTIQFSVSRTAVPRAPALAVSVDFPCYESRCAAGSARTNSPSRPDSVVPHRVRCPRLHSWMASHLCAFPRRCPLVHGLRATPILGTN
ncbi:hypothetical protein DFH09DRAFT_478340 [Mycena vulgaris]|nr:hypothetical protein DFH09DRAFT_478340 [Mycena vulgaris]